MRAGSMPVRVVRMLMLVGRVLTLVDRMANACGQNGALTTSTSLKEINLFVPG